MGTTTKSIAYRYDAVGNRSLLVDPDGGRFTYTYDSLNRISHLENPENERTTYAYDDNGRRTVKKLANGTRASFSYDDAGNLTRLANLKSDGTTISSFDYAYDRTGNRTSVLEADGSRVTWSYDATYQLTGEHRTGSNAYRNTFTYDAAGNRTLKNESGQRTTYAYDAANQLKTDQAALGTTTYTFDADGNQQIVQPPTGPRTTTTWDYENRTTLVELASGLRNTMAYEPDGLRIKLEDSTGSRKFVWDDQNYLVETDDTDSTQVVYTNAPRQYGNLISQRRASTTNWYHFDAIGSTRELTLISEAVSDTYLYDAWGVPVAATGGTANPFRFVGKLGYYFDVDSDSNYVRARFYQPVIARWIIVDPLPFLDGFNSFQYVRGNPVGNTDPSGMACVTASGVHYEPRGRFTDSMIREQTTRTRVQSGMQVEWEPDSQFTQGGCCCCDKVGFVQIARRWKTERVLGLIDIPADSGFFVDGGIPYPHSLRTALPGRTSRSNTGDPCKGTTIGMGDIPGISKSTGLARLVEFSMMFETCVVCLSGVEGISRTAFESTGAGARSSLGRLVVYGCFTWEVHFTGGPTSYQVTHHLGAASTAPVPSSSNPLEEWRAAIGRYPRNVIPPSQGYSPSFENAVRDELAVDYTSDL